jgi:hypothetical protein
LRECYLSKTNKIERQLKKTVAEIPHQRGQNALSDLFGRYQRFRIINGPIVVEGYGLVTVKNGADDKETRLDHDSDIEGKAYVTYIIGIPLVPAENAFKIGGRPTIAPHLRKTGDAGPGQIPEGIVRDKIGEFIGIL